jgi:predicted dehydrogenase
VTGARESLCVGIVGCGLVGRKRAAALDGDELVGCFDVDERASSQLANDFGGTSCRSLEALLALRLDTVIVATPHNRLASSACAALNSGAHVLVEKPGGIGVAEIDRVEEVARANDRLARVGFNHRFHPGIARAIAEAASGRFGPILHIRARYGHGGRVGYEDEWRTSRDLSGGGELVDQGMHLLDLSYAMLGPLPLRTAFLRTAFWPVSVEDNALVILGDAHAGPWSWFHVSWTEWKNLFSLEICCRSGKLQVDGLAGSYGPQRLTIYAMRPELGPPDVEEFSFTPDDSSWIAEWRAFRDSVRRGPPYGVESLASARYCWHRVEDAYASAGDEVARV